MLMPLWSEFFGRQGQCLDLRSSKMTVDTIIDETINVVIHTVYGKIGPDDVKHILNGLVQNPSFDKNMNVVWDFQAISDMVFSTQELKRIVSHTEAYLEHRNSGYKLALVAKDDLLFGLGRMFMAYCEHLPIKIIVVRSLADALAWVDPG